MNDRVEMLKELDVWCARNAVEGRFVMLPHLHERIARLIRDMDTQEKKEVKK